MKNVITRSVLPCEVGIVQDLNYALFESDNRHFKDLNMEWTYGPKGTEYFRRLANGEYGVCFVAEVDGEVVGYLAGALLERDHAYMGKRAELENMFVREEYRSQGIGKQLVEKFFEWCKEQNVDMAFVSAFSPNTRAISFYGRAGFDTEYSVNLMKRL